MRTLALVLLLSRPAQAAFTELGAGARAPGMGDSFTAVADDVYALHYNPAGLSLLQRPELGTSYTRLLMGLDDGSALSNSFLGYAHPLPKNRGGVAASWEQFALGGGLYQEQAFTFGHGRRLGEFGPGFLHGGANLRVLRRAFGSTPEASSALNGIAATGQSDPVLNGRRSKTAPDADLGFLYRLRDHYSLGLAIRHVMEPNVAFSSGEKDKVARHISFGGGYRSLLSNVGAQYDTVRAPTGALDQRFTVAIERWFPKLFVGEFGLRGALGLGTREFKQITTGVSYRTGRFGVDYAFAMPIQTVTQTMGTHRFALSLKFGSTAEPDESVVMILEAMRRMKIGSVPELSAVGPGLSSSQKAQLDELLAQTKALQAQGQYRAATEKLSAALTLSPGDADLLKGFGRLNFVSQAVPELPAHKTDPVQGSWHQGILAYFAQDDIKAVDRTAYAHSLAPTNQGLGAFLTQLEAATGIKRPVFEVAKPAQLDVETWLAQAAEALEAGRYDEAVDLSRKVLRVDEKNLSAWENLGMAYFAVGAYAQSLEAWETAYKLERDPARRTSIAATIKSVRAVMVRAPRVRASEGAVARPVASPQEIQKLYNQGVDHYTAGRLDEARASFEGVLALDPAYAPAGKALRRVVEEIRSR
jgi:tetratricopeptide (TPR) repeat protein